MLGVRLVQRTTRRQSLTEDGKVFLRRAQLITREVQLAADEIADRKGQLVGPLRISPAPVTFGYLHLGPALYPFLQKYPGIELTLDLDDRFVDVEAEGYDAVLRHGPVLEGWLVVSRIAPSRRMLVAAPAYLAQAGTPRYAGRALCPSRHPLHQPRRRLALRPQGQERQCIAAPGIARQQRARHARRPPSRAWGSRCCPPSWLPGSAAR